MGGSQHAAGALASPFWGAVAWGTMSLFDRRPSVDPRVVLELAPGPEGSAQGTLDGAQLSLDWKGWLHIPVEGRWPGAVDALPGPKRALLGAPALQNRAARPAWMEEVFARPEIQACVQALTEHPLAIEVSERSLRVRWTAAAEGPAVRRATRGLISLARALPPAMREVVEDRAAADAEARRQASLARSAALPRPPTEAELRVALRKHLDWFDGSALFAGLGGVLLLAVFTFAPGRLSLVLGVCWFGLAWSSALLRCPRCHRRLLSWTRARRGPRRRTCAHCGLRAADADGTNEGGGAGR